MSRKGEAAAAPSAMPWVGSAIRAELAEIAASLVEEVAPVMVAAARGRLDIAATLGKLRELHAQMGDYLSAIEAQVQSSERPGGTELAS